MATEKTATTGKKWAIVLLNLLTASRAVCAVALSFFPVFSFHFYCFYGFGGAGDVLDGFLARRFRLQTKFGSAFDTFADVLLFFFVAVKIIGAYSFPTWLFFWVGAIAVLKTFNAVRSFVSYKRPCAEHTTANKICGCVLFLLPFALKSFSRGFLTGYFLTACALGTFASVQEGRLIGRGKETE